MEELKYLITEKKQKRFHEKKENKKDGLCEERKMFET